MCAKLLFVLLGIFLCCVSAGAQHLTKRIDNLPMYGQPGIVRSPEMKALDEKFISEAVAGLGTRERASDGWWSEGERFMANRNLDFAMRQYNQAWLLNPQSFKPYWGFARVMLESRELDASILYFGRAIELVNDKFQEPALLSDAGNAYLALARSQKEKIDQQRYFSKANDLYEKAIAIDPEYGNSYRRYAIALYFQGEYALAWKMVREARKRKDTPISKAFLDDLSRAMPEPLVP